MGAICSCKCCGCSKQKQNPPQPPPKEITKPVLVMQPKPEPKPEPIKEEPKPEPKPEPKKEEPIKVEPKKEESFLPPEIVEAKVDETEKPNDVQKEENISQVDKDEEDFDQALTTILESDKAFQKNKKQIEEQLSACFKQDQYQLKDCSENPYFSGPKIANRNICDIENKYDFSRVKEFKEYNEDITLVRLIQKQKTPICTYLGKIQGKYCCVKLLPMAKKADIQKWIESVKKAQEIKNDVILISFCQKYFYYKIEEIKNEPEYCNCYIIAKLEQFNTYTFSHHQSIQLAERINVAYKAIQIISLVLKSKFDQDGQNERLSKQIFKKMSIVKGNNLLISRDQDNIGNYKLLLSDWQLLLDEFEDIIPNQKLQNQDMNYENNEKSIVLLQSISGNIKNAAQLQKDLEFVKNLKVLDDFTTRILRLLFFRVNFQLLENVELKGFVNESLFIEVGKKINIIEKNERIEHGNLKTVIQRYSQHETSDKKEDKQLDKQQDKQQDKKEDNQQEKKQSLEETAKNLQNKLSQLLLKDLGLYNSPNSNLLYLIYLLIEDLLPEGLRPILKDLNIDHHLESQPIKK